MKARAITLPSQESYAQSTGSDPWSPSGNGVRPPDHAPAPEPQLNRKALRAHRKQMQKRETAFWRAESAWNHKHLQRVSALDKQTKAPRVWLFTHPATTTPSERHPSVTDVGHLAVLDAIEIWEERPHVNLSIWRAPGTRIEFVPAYTVLFSVASPEATRAYLEDPAMDLSTVAFDHVLRVTIDRVGDALGPDAIRSASERAPSPAPALAASPHDSLASYLFSTSPAAPPSQKEPT